MRAPDDPVASQPAVDEPITVVITRTVREGKEAEFEEAVRTWIRTALTFPGYLGVHMLRPPPGSRDYGAVLKFESRRNWESFRAFPAYQAFLERIHDLLVTDAAIETVTGLESWFTPPGTPLAVAPPRWKMALVTWVGVNLTTSVLALVLSPITSAWSAAAAAVAFNTAVVVGLTWLVMPALSWLFRSWLFPAGGKET